MVIKKCFPASVTSIMEKPLLQILSTSRKEKGKEHIQKEKHQINSDYI